MSNTGEYIQADDDRVRHIINSWRGTRPVLHYSLSRENIVSEFVATEQHLLLDMDRLLTEGYKTQKLRAHSDYYWNTAANQWALSFWPSFDICCESKAKNLASFALYELAVKSSS
jgi:UV DNA damage endonuclease